MPLTPQRLDNNIRHRLPALPALRAVPVRVAIAAPRIPILLHKRRAGIERIAALSAEEVSGVPLRAARDDDFTLDRRLARFAAGAEEFVEVEGAVEAEGGLAVAFFGVVQFFDCQVFGDHAGLAGFDSL